MTEVWVGLISGCVTAIVTLLGAWFTMRSKDKETAATMNQIASEIVQESIANQNKSLAVLRIELGAHRRALNRLRSKYGELHGSIVRLRASFDAIEVHLANYYDLVADSPEAAERFKSNLSRDMGIMRTVLEQLAETSSPEDDLDQIVQEELVEHGLARREDYDDEGGRNAS